MRIDIISCIPESFTSIFSSSILGRAIKNNMFEIHVHNLHDYALDKFRHIDDAPFGGGSGMVIKCQPVFDCIESLTSKIKYDEIIFLTPDAPLLNQSICNKLSLFQNILILCGHYKGIDQRVRDKLVTMELSIGDYVLTGGELPAMVLIDSIARLVPGVLGDSESALTDSFMDGLLEAPQYTRPAEFKGMTVPDVLLSGNHEQISKWRQEQSIEKTKKIRPDLLSDELL